MEVLEERDGYRVRLEQDPYAEEPYDEGSSPVLRLELLGYVSGSSRYGAKHVDSGKWKRDKIDSAVEYAAERLAGRYDKVDTLVMLERYLRALFGVTKVEAYESGDYLYVAYDPAAWREEVGAPEGSVSLAEYKAWVEGDVWSWVIEKQVTWTSDDWWPGTTEYAKKNTWEVVDSCASYYGSAWAEESAREAFEAVLRRKESA